MSFYTNRPVPHRYVPTVPRMGGTGTVPVPNKFPLVLAQELIRRVARARYRYDIVHAF